MVFRVEIFESQILELAAQLTHAEAVRDGRVNVHRLLGNALTLLGTEIFQGAHVMQAISQLDQHHADIVDHCQQHFADVLGLLFFLGNVADMRNLCEAFDQMGHFVAEIIANRSGVSQRVFNNVMQ